MASFPLGRAVAGLAAIGLLAGCASAPSPEPAASAGAPAAAPVPTRAKASADDAVNRVVAISVDGLNPTMLSQLGPTGAPNFHRMIREGASTLNARTEREQTRTLPNHTGMLTGRRIEAKTGGHGWTRNTDTGSTVHKTAGHYVASVFDVVHDHGGSTALYTAKSKFAVYARTWNTAGATDRVGRNNGRAKIDRFVVDPDNAQMVGRVTAELRRAPRTFTFVHISLPDAAGHRYGFMGAQYRAAVQQTDRLLGQILTTVAGSPALRRQTLVLLTADHGGSGASHDDAGKLDNYRIPFLAWGPGVARGANLYALNPTYRSPGSKRTSYSGRQPIRNGDLANLSTDVLDLPRVGGAEFDAKRKLTLFR